MTDQQRDPIAKLLDVVVFAPIGAFFHGPETVSQLAEKGRGQVANARIIGKIAIQRGRHEAEQWVNSAADTVAAAARAAEGPVADSAARPDATDAPDAGPEDRAGSGRSHETTGGVDTRDRLSHLAMVPDRQDAPSSESLPIPDYDTLSASQVMPRLDDLGRDELDAVSEYERAHRGRMTILSRIAQLRAS